MKIYVLDFTKRGNPVVVIVKQHNIIIKGIYDFQKDIFFITNSKLQTQEQFLKIVELLEERDWHNKIVFICKKFKNKNVENRR